MLKKLRSRLKTLSATSGSHSGERAMETAMLSNVELCQEILTNTQNAVEVLDDLLNYDKIEVGGLALELSFVAVEQLLRHVVKTFQGPARKKDVTIISKTTDYMCQAVRQSTEHGGKFVALRVVGDRIRLQQVIRNLISNALKFSPPAGNIVVELTCVEHGLDDQGETSMQISNFIQLPAAPSLAKQMMNSFRSSSLAPSARTQGGTGPGSQFLRNNKIGSLSDAEQGQGKAAPPVVPASIKLAMNRKNTPLSILRSVRGRSPVDSSTCRRWGALRLSVSDGGAGMTRDQLKHVCTEGVQFNANELQAGQGSGLGLFITKGNNTVDLRIWTFA